MVDYKESGVNISLGDEASKILYDAAKKTWENRRGKFGEVVELFSDFSGLRAIKVGLLPSDTYMNLGFDGIGTKIEAAERTAQHSTVGFDLFAMVCDDAVVRGAEPVLIGSILDVNKLRSEKRTYIQLIRQLAEGYVAAAKEANVAVVNGELAELGARVNGYGEFNYNWGAGIAWFGRESRLLSGYKIKKHDSIVALKEKGFRSNGLSLVRAILEKTHGQNWHKSPYKIGKRGIAELVLQPSRIYCAAVVEMFGGVFDEPKAEIHGIVHITGGGIPGKLGRVLKPSGHGAELDNLFEPPDIMKYIQEIGNVRDAEAYRTWNMGQGMLIITPQPDKVQEIAEKHGIESRIAGHVTKDPRIIIRNKGMGNDRTQYLEF